MSDLPLPLEPLREFLLDALPPEPYRLGENEIITDAVVLFRVVDITGEGLELYRYTTSKGCSLAMAAGIIKITDATLMDYYTRLLVEEDEDGDD